jgi:protein-S-isoprenylcysteine O-methyltransferase Ste14
MDLKATFPSCARWYDPFAAAIASIAVFCEFGFSSLSTPALALLVILAALLPPVAAEFLSQRARFGTRPPATLRSVCEQVAVKWLGICGGVALMVVYWWLFPLYDGLYYRAFFQLLPQLLPWILLLCLGVSLYTEWRLGSEEDQNRQLGLLVLGRWREIHLPILKTAFLALLVRAIFLPMNFAALINGLTWLREFHWQLHQLNFAELHYLGMKIFWTLLIAAIVPGYLFSSRLLGTSVRRADASWLGWIMTMVCYPPLLAGVLGQWFKYNAKLYDQYFMRPWVELTQDIPMAMLMVGLIILLTEIVHWWGEAILGIRASNLTHRGVITNGPFRLSRHPIYVAKCIGWLFISLPFVMGSDWLDSLRLTLLWGGVCAIFFGRAWVEERLFADDPVYVEYALWIDKHGWLAWLGRIFPPATFAWKLKRWQANGAVSRETVP